MPTPLGWAGWPPSCLPSSSSSRGRAGERKGKTSWTGSIWCPGATWTRARGRGRQLGPWNIRGGVGRASPLPRLYSGGWVPTQGRLVSDLSATLPRVGLGGWECGGHGLCLPMGRAAPSAREVDAETYHGAGPATLQRASWSFREEKGQRRHTCRRGSQSDGCVLAVSLPSVIVTFWAPALLGY